MAEELSASAGILTGQQASAGAEEPQLEQAKPAEELEPAIREPDPEPKPDGALLALAEEPAGGMSVKQLAEKLGVRPQDVYADLSLEIGGKTLTLSELKDRGKELVQADKVLADAEEHRTKIENDLLRRQRAADIAMQGREPTQEQLDAADDAWATYAGDQNARVLGVISSWSDATVQRQDLTDMAKLLGEYGYSPVEIGRRADHRDVKQVYDHMLLKRRLAAAQETEVKPTLGQGSRSRRKSVHKPAQVAVDKYKAGELSQVAAVTALIAEGKD